MIINTLTARDGTEIIEIDTGERMYRLNSVYKPYSEAERFAAQFDGTDNKVLIVFGCGNGIIPEELMKVCGNQVKLILYEPCHEMNKYLQKSKSWKAMISQDNVYIVCSGMQDEEKGLYNIDDFSMLLENIIDHSNYQNIKYIALPQYREIFPEEYAGFEKAILYVVRRIKANIATAKDMGIEAAVNNIMNLKYIKDSYCADTFVGRFPKGLPAIIASAGPSLEKNVQALKQFKGHAFIICVDTATAYLLREHIIPDVIICVDAVKPLSMFNDDRILGIPFVVGSDVNYKVLERMKGSPIIFASTGNPYIQSLYSMSGHSIDKLKSGGSVATLAFSLCLYWGFKEIIFVGQDLALTDERMYAGDIDNPVIPDSAMRHRVEVEGIYGDTLYTFADYYSYLMWFEQEIAIHPEVNVIDATEGGALIHGTHVMRLKELEEVYCKNPEYNFIDIINEITPAFDMEQKQQIEGHIQQSINNLQRLKEMLHKGASIAQKAVKLSENDEMCEQCNQLDIDMQKINDFYNSLDENFLIQRIIDATELEFFMSLFQGIEGIPRTERYRRMKDYYECILRALQVVEETWRKLDNNVL